MTATATRPPDAFLEVMRSLPSGVCVVTAISRRRPAGMTAGSVTTLSVAPMLVALTLRPASQTLATVRAGGRFGVNLMSARHRELALRFASQRAGEEKYAGVPHRLHAGVPVLDDARAWLVCGLHSARPVGDHVLVIGDVIAISPVRPADPALITHHGRLTALPA
jgi:3-hydroxy-9,10-secoandrosta-1,3,5(10)-triene-9,17-dione monooxygenase reductase component